MENNLHIIVGDPEKQTKNIHLPFKIEIAEDIFAEVRYLLNSAQNYLSILIFLQTSTARSFSPLEVVTDATKEEETKSADIQEQGFGLWIIFGEKGRHKRLLDYNFMCTLFCFNKV